MPLWRRQNMMVRSFIQKLVNAAGKYYRWRLAFGIPS